MERVVSEWMSVTFSKFHFNIQEFRLSSCYSRGRKWMISSHL